MRVCPDCGRQDLPWKHRYRRLFTDYCHIEELVTFDSELAEKLKKSPKFYSDGTFNYRLKPDGFVFRIWKKDAKTPISLYEPNKERRTLLPTKNQQKLTESCQKIQG